MEKDKVDELMGLGDEQELEENSLDEDDTDDVDIDTFDDKDDF